MGLRRWVVVLLLSCNNTNPPSVTTVAPTVAPTVSADAAPVPAKAPAATFPLPPTVGLPAPYARLRPFMKRGEALGLIGGLEPADAPDALRALMAAGSFSKTAVPNVFVSLTFSADRLTHVSLISTPAELLAAPAHAAWGRGATGDPLPFLYRTTETWPATTNGWTAALSIGPSKDAANMYAMPDLYGAPTATDVPTFAELDLAGSDPHVAEQVAPSSAPPLASIAKLLGQPMTAATTLFGEALHLEADDNQTRVAESDQSQGYARVKFPWSDDMWEVTLRVDKTSQRIAHVRLEGRAADYAPQFALIKNLEAAFGPRKPVVDEVGDPAIGFGASSVQAFKDSEGWTIDLRR